MGWGELNKIAENDYKKLSLKLIELSKSKRPIGGSWFEYIVERFENEELYVTNENALSIWALAISESMDKVLNSDNIIRFLTLTPAKKAKYLLQKIIRNLREKNDQLAAKTIKQIFEKCPSINWLTGHFLRTELYDHGIVGDRSNPNNRSLLPKEIEMMRDILKGRLIEENTQSRIENFPDFSAFIYGWREIDETSAKKWVKNYTKTDAQFLDFLLKIRGWAQSDKIYYPLRKEAVEAFLNWDETMKRIENIKKEEDNQIVEKLTQVEEAIKSAERW